MPVKNNLSTYIILSNKTWHDQLFDNLKNSVKGNWIRIREKKDFTLKTLKNLKPSKIFIPHWSYIIPKEIIDNYECVVFHMTDLPYGRGGSPLQNLIVSGHDSTIISAIKAQEGIDTGGIYLKKPLSLLGTAEEIFVRAASVIEKMITIIIMDSPAIKPQKGKVVNFKRRKPEESSIAHLNSLTEIYDYIRMLDCEGYPKAFIDFGKFRLEFSRASLKSNKSIVADVRIFEK